MKNRIFLLVTAMLAIGYAAPIFSMLGEVHLFEKENTKDIRFVFFYNQTWDDLSKLTLQIHRVLKGHESTIKHSLVKYVNKNKMSLQQTEYKASSRKETNIKNISKENTRLGFILTKKFMVAEDNTLTFLCECSEPLCNCIKQKESK